MAEHNNTFREISAYLHELLEHARTEGKNIAGDVNEYLSGIADQLSALIASVGTDLKDAVHAPPLEKLVALVHHMVEQVEHNHSIQSFWEHISEEIPHIVEEIEAFAETSEEVLTESAEVIEELATEI